MSIMWSGNDPRVVGFVAVEKSPDHRVLQIVGPFDEAEDAARYIYTRRSAELTKPYWIVSTILRPE